MEMLIWTSYRRSSSDNAGWPHSRLPERPTKIRLRVSRVYLRVFTAVNKADCLKKFQSEKAEAQRISEPSLVADSAARRPRRDGDYR
jgi:hypothetical protein